MFVRLHSMFLYMVFSFSIIFLGRTMEVWRHFGTRWSARPWSLASSRSHCLQKDTETTCERQCLEQHSWLQSLFVGKLWMLRLRRNWAWTNCLLLRTAKCSGRLLSLMGLSVGLQVACWNIRAVCVCVCAARAWQVKLEHTTVQCVKSKFWLTGRVRINAGTAVGLVWLPE